MKLIFYIIILRNKKRICGTYAFVRNICTLKYFCVYWRFFKNIGDIRENICWGKENATDEEIVEALKMACAWEFVEKLPDTFNSKIGEKGRGFSEGQTQRIAIARAILRDAPILLLDEATSALDVTTERKVLKNIIQQRPNKTCIVTTHRPTVLNMCQRVYRVMNTKVTALNEEESSRMAMDF